MSARPATCLVTGGALRLGRAIALELAASGRDVVIHYNRSRDAAHDTAEAIRAMGRAAWTVAAELADPNAGEELVAEAVGLAGGLDVLINSASIFPEDDLMGMTLEALEANVHVNAYAPLAATRAFARQGRRGAVVNLLDTRYLDYDARHVSYHLSKRMLYSLTRMLAVELAPEVRVNAVAPGLVLPPPGEDRDYLERLRTTNPLEAIGDPADVAAAVRYLVDASFVTGQVIFVDGGRHLRGTMY